MDALDIIDLPIPARIRLLIVLRATFIPKPVLHEIGLRIVDELTPGWGRKDPGERDSSVWLNNQTWFVWIAASWATAGAARFAAMNAGAAGLDFDRQIEIVREVLTSKFAADIPMPEDW